MPAPAGRRTEQTEASVVTRRPAAFQHDDGLIGAVLGSTRGGRTGALLKGEHIRRWVGGADRQDADRQQQWRQPEHETPGRGETGLRAADYLGLRIWVRLDLPGPDALERDAPNRALAALPPGLSAVCSKPLR